ncbi:hypothetical protein G7K_0910-t1 [Saitoella complicata NRRL Y-17804]|uniref:Uncharacterized protein n=1 Tax=Saitoella complicata (strain BCRC 22490 / CBS 7301 / JCM 7358 / NBRC 10748 / NRRL Y-17804) TaxID=698492 RepID=A0A0E9NAF3_SAICN|nr:hypothetical protein G7K_0910-t1 [Saitoella complicata NRRL Y-17804]
MRCSCLVRIFSFRHRRFQSREMLSSSGFEGHRRFLSYHRRGRPYPRAHVCIMTPNNDLTRLCFLSHLVEAAHLPIYDEASIKLSVARGLKNWRFKRPLPSMHILLGSLPSRPEFLHCDQRSHLDHSNILPGAALEVLEA